jgi:hypothetical protein
MKKAGFVRMLFWKNSLTESNISITFFPLLSQILTPGLPLEGKVAVQRTDG